MFYLMQAKIMVGLLPRPERALRQYALPFSKQPRRVKTTCFPDGLALAKSYG